MDKNLINIYYNKLLKNKSILKLNGWVDEIYNEFGEKILEILFKSKIKIYNELILYLDSNNINYFTIDSNDPKFIKIVIYFECPLIALKL